MPKCSEIFCKVELIGKSGCCNCALSLVKVPSISNDKLSLFCSINPALENTLSLDPLESLMANKSCLKNTRTGRARQQGFHNRMQGSKQWISFPEKN